MGEDFVNAGLFDVEDFTFDRQDGLKVAVAALFGRATGRFSLYDEDLTLARVAFGTVRQFSWQCPTVHRVFTNYQFTGLLGGVHERGPLSGPC